MNAPGAKARRGKRQFKLSPRLQAITFDVGGTLLEPWPSVGHVYAEVAARHGWPGLSHEALTRQFLAAWRARHHFQYTRVEWAELVDETFRGLIPKPPGRALFGELYDLFNQPRAWRIFDDVIPALDALAARGLKLGLISNWDARLRPLLRRLKLYDRFDAVVVSCHVGFPKPSPIIFERAAAELALPPGAILHVGDSLEMDVRGAHAAGFQALLLRRGARRRAPGQIASLAELA